MRIKIAARSSDLARLQAQTVGQALLASKQVSEVEFNFRASLGDLNQHDPLWKMPEKGVFTEDFLSDLESGACDLVVHSWKDLPTEPRKKTAIVATMPRADLRDLFLLKHDAVERVRTTKKLRVLTSSPRRAYNLKNFFKNYLPFPIDEVEFVNVRGNIPTRLRKIFSEDADALIVAKAAMDRLLSATAEEYRDVRAELRENLNRCQWMALPLSVNPTAAAQGALAIEVRNDRDDLKKILKSIHCEQTFVSVQRERDILSSYGGGCHQKIGVSVLIRDYGNVLFLRGLTDLGETLNKAVLERPNVSKIKVNPELVWPLTPSEGFFKREVLPESQWQSQLQNARYVYVARETALPMNVSLKADQIVWSAGLKTWKKLAERGTWVNGSSEGLGEDDLCDIATLVSEAPKWLRLTHQASAEGEPNSLGTYKLVPRTEHPNLKGKTHFFWMSGSSFTRAIVLYPELVNAHHSCGPGKTFSAIKPHIKAPGSLSVYLSYEDWLSEVTQLKGL
jgi:hydroxymethylbilane synthase